MVERVYLRGINKHVRIKLKMDPMLWKWWNDMMSSDFTSRINIHTLIGAVRKKITTAEQPVKAIKNKS